MERLEFLKYDLSRLRSELKEYQEMQISFLEELETLEQFEDCYEDLEHDFNKECEELLRDVIRVNKEIFSNMINLKWQQLKEKEGATNV